MHNTTLIGKSQGNIPFEGPRPTCVGHTIMDTEEVWCGMNSTG